MTRKLKKQRTSIMAKLVANGVVLLEKFNGEGKFKQNENLRKIGQRNTTSQLHAQTSGTSVGE